MNYGQLPTTASPATVGAIKTGAPARLPACRRLRRGRPGISGKTGHYPDQLAEIYAKSTGNYDEIRTRRLKGMNQRE
jgi:hypothetical protein